MKPAVSRPGTGTSRASADTASAHRPRLPATGHRSFRVGRIRSQSNNAVTNYLQGIHCINFSSFNGMEAYLTVHKLIPYVLSAIFLVTHLLPCVSSPSFLLPSPLRKTLSHTLVPIGRNWGLSWLFYFPLSAP